MPARRRSHDLPRIIPQDFGDYAINFFFNSYILLPMASNIQNGFLDCLIPIWTQATPASPLRPAVNAVALCLLEAWSQRNPNSVQSLARSHYVQGIAAIRRYLQSPDAIDDDVVMASLMLDMYDGITSFCGSRPHQGPHMAGSRALIEDGRRLPSNSEASRTIATGVRGQIVGRAFGRKEPVSRDVLIWTKSAQDMPRTPAFDLEDIEYDVANLQASASAPESRPDLEAKTVCAMETLSKANELEQRLAAWIANIPTDWAPGGVRDIEQIPPSIRDAGLYEAYCIVHKNIFIANTFNRHCCARIRVQLVIIACLERLANTSLGMTGTGAHHITSEKARYIIQESTDTVCASVPYFLGDRNGILQFDDKTVLYPRVRSDATPPEHYAAAAAYGGIFLTQRLAELLQPDLPLRDGQRQWIFGQMQRIRRIYLVSPN